MFSTKPHAFSKLASNAKTVTNETHLLSPTAPLIIYICENMTTMIFAEFQHITQTRPCNIQQYFTTVKMLIFRYFFRNIFSYFFAQTLIVGTC